MAKGCAVVAAIGTAKIRLTESINLASAGFSVTAWIKLTDVATSNIRALVSFRTAAAGVGMIDVPAGTYGSNELRAESGTGTVTGWTDGPELFPPPTVGDWYGYAMTFKDSVATTSARVYSNAFVELMEDLGTGASGGSTLDYIELGSRPSTSWVMGCSVAQGRVWSRMLSDAELAAEIASSAPVSSTNLVSAFEDDPTTDISGNAKPWTVSNVTTSSADWPPNYPLTDPPILFTIRSANRLRSPYGDYRR